MNKEVEKRLDELWEKAAHGTWREDLEAAFKLGVEAARERTVSVTVEALGTITWPNPDDKWNSPEPCARVLDEHGFRHLVTGGQCFRNGTVLQPKVVGKRGTVGLFHSTVVWFNCPTLFSG